MRLVKPERMVVAIARGLLTRHALALGLVMGAAGSAAAQAPGAPIDSLVARCERELAARATVRPATLEILHELMQGSNGRASRRSALVPRLERLALLSANEYVQVGAVGLLAQAGSLRARVPAPGVVPRLIGIYRVRSDFLVQLTILDELPYQSERAPAVAFLRALASEADPVPLSVQRPEAGRSHGDTRMLALGRLAQMGVEGQRALRAMHASGEARSPQARERLASLAAQGFPVRDLGREARARPAPR
jgi:hypothetical protein